VQVTWCRTEECIRRVQECGANEPTFNPEACKVGAVIVLLLFTALLLATLERVVCFGRPSCNLGVCCRLRRYLC
jgi:hypothetical protein